MAIVAFSIVRKQFSAFVRRAEAGEEIIITRRGKPNARLIPPERQELHAEGEHDKQLGANASLTAKQAQR